MNMKLLRQTEFNPRDNKHFEGAMTQGNGYLNIRASFEEDLSGEAQNESYIRLPANVTLEKIRNPISKWGVYVPGIYGLHPLLGEEIVNLPYLLGINLYCSNEKFSMEESLFDSFDKTLDMNTGILKRSLVWQTKQGPVKIQWKRYLSMVQPNRTMQQVTFTSEKAVEIQVESFIDGDVTTNGYCHFTDWECHLEDAGMLVTLDSGQQVGMKVWDEVKGAKIQKRTYEQNNHRISQYQSFLLQPGTVVSYEKQGFVTADVGEYREEKHLSLCEEKQKEIWKRMWQRAEVKIEGDENLQKSLDYSIYHLLRSANRGSNVAIDAKGFAGEAYFGHFFWDTEIYMLPFFNCTWKEQAKRLVDYRFKALKGAKENAARYGYPGARYPWEGCASGKEQCSNWQYADLEVHVTADVVYGIWEYYKATGDQAFLLQKGVEIMVETARYWMARIEKKGDQYHLNGVMGPDEYLPFTNDNAFTNFMVRFALGRTVETLAMATKEQKLQLHVTESETDEFRAAATGLTIHRDIETGLIWQCKDFDKFKDLDFDAIWTDRTKPFGVHISQEQNYRSKALKQADVASMLYLFEDSFDDCEVKTCMEYYEPYTTHDSSLSYIIHSLIYGRLGDTNKSYEFMIRSMDIDLGRKGASEGIHIANAGGIWQGVVKGFGGFKGFDEKGKLIIRPGLPEHIKSIGYQVVGEKKCYHVRVTHNQVEVRETE